MRRLIPLALIALAGCKDNPGDRLGEHLSCEHDPHEWYDNPFASLLQGDGGEFDLDPIGDSVIRRSGSYDFETGEYSVVSTYAEEHPFVTVQSEGYGTIYDNGDLDLITKAVTTDVLGETWAEQVRTKREGCTGTIRSTELDLDAPVDARPSEFADSFEWSVTIVSDTQVDYRAERQEEYGLYVTESSMSPDHASQGSFDYADGAYLGTMTREWDGTGTTTWEQYGATFGQDSDFIGEDQHHLDGSRLTAYDIYEAGTSSLQAEVELLWLYDGSATGSYSVHQNGQVIDCDITITEGGEVCTMECGSYGSYDC
jgi:hypothetical protein